MSVCLDYRLFGHIAPSDISALPISSHRFLVARCEMMLHNEPGGQRRIDHITSVLLQQRAIEVRTAELPSSTTDISPIAAERVLKRACSPEGTQAKKARLSPTEIKCEFSSPSGETVDCGTSSASLSPSASTPSPCVSSSDERAHSEDEDEKVGSLTHLDVKLDEYYASSSADTSPNFRPVLKDTDVFSSVPGRLALLNNSSKYDFTLAELKRRLGAPECLNASVLGAILRRAKSKNGGKELRVQVERFGLDIPVGKRKTSPITLFTALTEGEALHLARDFGSLCDSEFPVRAITKHVYGVEREKDAVDCQKKTQISSTISVLGELRDVLAGDRSPIMDHNMAPVLPQALQGALSHFSRCTHGFGIPAIAASIDLLVKILDLTLNPSMQSTVLTTPRKSSKLPTPQMSPVITSLSPQQPQKSTFIMPCPQPTPTPMMNPMTSMSGIPPAALQAYFQAQLLHLMTMKGPVE